MLHRTRKLIIATALATPIAAQCTQGFSYNWSAPLTNGQEAGNCEQRAVRFTNTHPHEIKICSVALRLSHNMNLYLGGNATVFYTLIRAQQIGPLTLPTGPILAISTPRTVPSTPQVIRSSFAIDPVLQPGQTVFLSANYSIPSYYLGNGNIRSIRTSGSQLVDTWRFGSVGAFQSSTWSSQGQLPMSFDIDARFTVDGSSASIGGGCGGTQLSGGTPLLGFAWNSRLTGANGVSPAMITIGLTNPDTDLAPFGAPGCTLRSSLDSIAFGVANAAGEYSRQFSISNDPALLGVTFYAQGAALKPAVNPLGLALSNARRLEIGDY